MKTNTKSNPGPLSRALSTPILTVAITAFTLWLPATAISGTFADDFSTGLNPTYWTVSQTTPNIYSLDATNGDVRLAKIAPTTGLQGIAVDLNMPAVGGSIVGDFSAQIDFSNAIIGPGTDQVELHTYFADTSFFFDVYDNNTGPLGVHVWNGSGHGETPVAVNFGTLSIARSGSILTAYFNGSTIFSEFNASPLTGVEFVLQNQPNGINDTPSVTYDNFSYTGTGVVPEPTSAALLLGGSALLALRRRRGRCTCSSSAPWAGARGTATGATR